MYSLMYHTTFILSVLEPQDELHLLNLSREGY